MSKPCSACGTENPDQARFCLHCTIPFKQDAQRYDAFVSYRRDGGSETARLIQMALQTVANKRVFLDVDELETGRFDRRLLDIIEQTPHFVLILSKDSLARCNQPDDWLTQEIAHALRHRRNIIPVTKADFAFPAAEALPEPIREILSYNAVRYDHTYAQAAMTEILKFMARAVSVPLAATAIADMPVTVAAFASSLGATPASVMRLARDVLKIELRTPSAQLNSAQQQVLRDAITGQRAGSEALAEAQKTFELPGGVMLHLVRIASGAFRMGSPVEEEGHNDDEVLHEVRISKPYFMSREPVTQAQYEALMGFNPSYFNGPQRPVEMVSWFDAVSFCEALNDRFGRAFRLPTESEWEFACRAGSGDAFSCGKVITTEIANYDGKLGSDASRSAVSRWETTDVMTFPANRWGLHDMHGNVWEWCSDWYGDYPEGVAVDPSGPEEGEIRILRGGSWFHGPADARSAQRDALDPGRRHSIYGFRVAMSI